MTFASENVRGMRAYHISHNPNFNSLLAPSFEFTDHLRDLDYKKNNYN